MKRDVRLGSNVLSRRVYLTVVAALWVLLGLVMLLNQRGIFTPDIKPEVYLAPGRTASNYLSSWLDTQQLGFPNFNVGLAPVPAVVSLLQVLGIGPAVCVRFLHYALLCWRPGARCGSTSWSPRRGQTGPAGCWSASCTSRTPTRWLRGTRLR